MEIIVQYAKTFSDPPEKVRRGCRGLIIRNNKILLSYEKNTDVYMTPGGGIEPGETLEECVVREFGEETGYKIKVIEPYVTVHEYCFETLHENNYFICEITGETERQLTDNEIDHGLVAEWVDVERAIEIFATYPSKTEDIMSLYMREFTIINKYLNKKTTAL